MSHAKTIAEQLKKRPEIMAWIARLRDVVASTPSEVTVFVASGAVCVLAKNEKGETFPKIYDGWIKDGIDQDSMIECCGTGWDGGDW